MRKLYQFLTSILFIVLLSDCSDDEKHGGESLLGVWKFETEQYLEISGTDTLTNETYEDGRYFELQSDSRMIVYWSYPNDFDESIWERTGTDSLSLYFDGPDSHIIDKFKILKQEDSRMTLESTLSVDGDDIQKSVFQLKRIR